MNLVAKETFTPAFKELNPNGLAPVLVDGDFVLWESNAILVHLACQSPRSHWPTDLKQHMDILRWLFWQSCHWDPGLDTVGLETFVKKLEGTGDPDPHLMAHAYERIAKAAPVLDAHLATKRFVCGDAVTLADFAMASSMQYHHITDYRLESYGNIWRWYWDLWHTSPGWRSSEPDWAAIGLPVQIVP